MAADMFFDTEFLDKLTENLQRDILTIDVNTLLYDAGFSNGGKPRKKDKSMDIMDAYFRYVGDNPFLAVQAMLKSPAVIRHGMNITMRVIMSATD